ncbi:MAG: hypothetical protein P8Y20_12525 [Gammaproteobacteria bacterium]
MPQTLLQNVSSHESAQISKVSVVPKINLVFAHDTVIGATQFLGHNIENE